MKIEINDKLLYLFAGIGLGTVIGNLFSQSSGQEMRNTLSTRAHEGVDRLSQTVEEGRRFIKNSEIPKQAGDTVRSVVNKGKNVASIGKRRLTENI